jgi:hypothetical protein
MAGSGGTGPTPVFVRYEELTGRSFHVFYHDDDPSRVLREDQVAPGEAAQAPKDGLMGAGSRPCPPARHGR